MRPADAQKRTPAKTAIKEIIIIIIKIIIIIIIIIIIVIITAICDNHLLSDRKNNSVQKAMGFQIGPSGNVTYHFPIGCNLD